MARASGAAAPASPPRYAPISSTGMRPWPEAWVWAAARLGSGPITGASVDRTPDALRRDGHVEVFDAEFGEGVDDRVDDRAERRRRAAFAAAAQPEWVRRRGHFAELGHERWQRVRARQRVVHQRRGGDLTGRLVVRAELPERLADAGGDAAVRLAMQDHRIHRAPDVVHRGVSHDVDDAGVGIHFHFAHRAAVRIRRHRHDLGARAGERFAGTNGGRGDLEQIDGAVGALHGESATRELDVRLRGLEERRSDAPALLDDLIRGFRHDDGAESHRPAGRRPAADRHQIRVAGDELHAPMLDAKPLGDELGEARFVALNPDEVGIRSGGTAVVDQGGAAPLTTQGLRKFIKDPAATRVYAFVSNYLVRGLLGHRHVGLSGPHAINVRQTINAIEKNRDFVKGIKCHAEVGGYSRWGIETLRLGKEASSATKS